MITRTKRRKSKNPRTRFVGKPGGQIQERVRVAGPERFGVVAVDCAKRRSKWMLCNFYGKVIIEPTCVEHTAGGLHEMTQLITKACQAENLTDSIAAVEMTGVYHRPVYRTLRQAGFDTRIVHPFVSNHYRRPLHPDQKTDDKDLEAIFHAAINGYGLATLPVGEVYQALQATARHRHNLVKQRSRLRVQIRGLLHQTMPGFAELFANDKLFNNSIALPVALHFPSADAIRRSGAQGIASQLTKENVNFQSRTIERIVAWAPTAPPASELASIQTRQWQQLNKVRQLLDEQITGIEQEMASFLVKTPYILLLSVTGINVVSAARLAGEAGPIEHYATARAITGRAGLLPSRYQSDEVDRADGKLVRHCNRKLRGAAIQMADNLIKCHPHYRGLANSWKHRKIEPRDRRCRIANRAMRMVYQLVAGRQVWRGRGVNCEYVLAKLQDFHRLHGTPLEQSIRGLNEAFTWLPKSAYASEAVPLTELAGKRQRGPQRIGDLLIPLLARLGVANVLEKELESKSSEARSSD